MDHITRAGQLVTATLGLLFAAPAVGQDASAPTFLRVADLVQPAPCTSPYLTTAPLRGKRMLLGEESWVLVEWDNQPIRILSKEISNAWFSEGSFRAVVSDLLQHEDPSIQLLSRGSLLMVQERLREPVETLLAELRQRMPPSVRCDLQLVRIDSEGEHVVLAHALEVRAGRRGWVSSVQESSAVHEFEVEIAQSSTTSNPVEVRFGSGAMIVVRPIVALAAPDAWFEVLARVVEPGAEPRFQSGETSCGELDRVHQVVHEYAGVMKARLGGVVRQRWQGSGAAFELRLTPTWQVPAPTPVGARDVEYLPCWPDFVGFRSSPFLTDGPEDPPAVLSEFESALQAANAVARPVESCAANFGIDAEATALRAAQAARVAAHTPVRVRVEAFDAVVGSKPAADGSMVDARRLAHVELDTVLDTWACSTAYEELGYVPDWDVEVAQSARIPDPKTERLAAGMFVNVRCSGQLVELEGELSWRAAIEGRLVRLNRAMNAPYSATASSVGNNSAVVRESDGLQMPADVVRIESIARSKLPIQARLPLRRDQAATWRMTTPLLPAGRELLVVVRRVD